MKTFIFALLVALAAPASAQLIRMPQLPPPQPAPTEESSIPAPVEIGRKMQALEVAGLKLPPSSLQESVTLSARRPWIDQRTFVDFIQAIGYSTRHNNALIKAVPYASMVGAQLPHVELVWNADASKRHIIDCEVGGTATHIKFRWTDPAGEASVAISAGRVSTVLPLGVPGSLKLSADKDWRFHSCEITPVTL
ncbi:MAG TPA: hypothetical protein VNA29_02670 [Sphingomicrobium sp.]|nr:hypothetical protein [Sphingomicrobium sp.]